MTSNDPSPPTRAQRRSLLPLAILATAVAASTAYLLSVAADSMPTQPATKVTSAATTAQTPDDPANAAPWTPDGH